MADVMGDKMAALNGEFLKLIAVNCETLHLSQFLFQESQFQYHDSVCGHIKTIPYHTGSRNSRWRSGELEVPISQLVEIGVEQLS